MNNKIKSSRVVFLGVFTAVAMILAFIESQIPTFVPVPGIKIGLPNIAIVLILYKMGFKEALVVNILRILLVSFLFGTALSLIYSLSGGIISLVIMKLIKESNIFKIITVSVIGAITHNIVQIIVAIFVLELNQLIYYLPILLLTGTISGIIVGIVAGIIGNKVNLEEKEDA